MPLSNKYTAAIQHKILEIYPGEALDYYLLENNTPVISQNSLLSFLGVYTGDSEKVFFPEEKKMISFQTDSGAIEVGIPVEMLPLICVGFADFGISNMHYKGISENAFRLLISLSLSGLSSLIDETKAE